MEKERGQLEERRRDEVKRRYEVERKEEEDNKKLLKEEIKERHKRKRK